MKKENSFLKIELKGEDVGIRIQGSGKDVLNLYNLLTKHIKESILENAEKLKGIDDSEKEEIV